MCFLKDINAHINTTYGTTTARDDKSVNNLKKSLIDPIPNKGIDINTTKIAHCVHKAFTKVPSFLFLVKKLGNVPFGTSPNMALIGDSIQIIYAAIDVIKLIAAYTCTITLPFIPKLLANI